MAVDPDLSTRLLEAVKLQALTEPDMYLVGREGTKIPAHRSVMGLFSPFLTSVLNDYPQHLTACLIIPESSSASLASMVAIFYSGLVPATPGDKEAVADIEKTCRVLGFQIDLQPKVVVMDTQVTEVVVEDKSPYTDGTNDKEEVPVIVSNKLETLVEKSAVSNKCVKCEFSSENPSNLMKHYAVNHFDANISQLVDFYFQLNTSTGRYGSCKVCNKAIATNAIQNNMHKEVIAHIGVYHMKILDILKTNKIEIPNLFRSKTYSDGSVVTATSPRKSGEFKCELCTASSFSTRTALHDHLSGAHFLTELVSAHGDKYTKSCNLCKFKFQTVQQLAKHIGTIHDKVMALYNNEHNKYKVNGLNIGKSLSCSFNCPEEFPDKGLLKKHYISHHFADELVRKFGSYESQCSLCFAWLNSKEELAVHIGDFHGKVNEMIQKPSDNQARGGEISEEILVKKMIEKSKKLMNERNLQMSKNASGGKTTVNISMRR